MIILGFDNFIRHLQKSNMKLKGNSADCWLLNPCINNYCTCIMQLQQFGLQLQAPSNSMKTFVHDYIKCFTLCIRLHLPFLIDFCVIACANHFHSRHMSSLKITSAVNYFFLIMLLSFVHIPWHVQYKKGWVLLCQPFCFVY